MEISIFIVPSCFALGFAWLGVWQRGATLVHHGMQLALRELNEDVDGAEQALDEIPRWARIGALGGVVFSTRSYIRWLQGDLAACEQFATRAIGADRVAVRTLFSDVTANALAIRALARAATQQHAEADADLEVVEANPSASFHARARAALARALLLAHDSDAPGLRKHLRRTRNAIVQAAHPREVMLLRALERHGRALPQPYRSTPGAAGSATAHAWLHTVAPALVERTEPAEPKVRSTSPSPLPPAPVPGLLGTSALKVVALWGLLIVMFLAIWQFASPFRIGLVPQARHLYGLSFPPNTSSWPMQTVRERSLRAADGRVHRHPSTPDRSTCRSRRLQPWWGA